MISRCGLLKKKASMSTEEFRDFWFNVHGPIACHMKNMRHYQQHLVIDREQRHKLARGPFEIDAYSELIFDDIHDMEEGVTSLNGAGADDLPNFVDDCKLVIFVKMIDTRVPEEFKGQKLIKRMSLLSRAKGISSEEFQQEWWETYSSLLKKVPGYLGYAQNLVIDRIIDGKHAPYDALPIDGMVEFWFKDMESLNQFYASEAFAKTSEHGKTFLSNVTTYLMETADYPMPGDQYSV